MRVRAYLPSDELPLRDIYAATDFHQREFPDLTKQLVTGVLADEKDAPLMAGYVRLIPEATLICAPGGTLHPLVKLRGIKMLHENLGDVLTAMGYSEAIGVRSTAVARVSAAPATPPELAGILAYLPDS